MAEAKESKVALEDLQSSIEDIVSKVETNQSGINERLDSLQKSLDNVPDPTPSPNLAPKEEGYVPKAWAPDENKGWNDVFSQGAKISEKIAEEKAIKVIDDYKAELKEAAAKTQTKNDAVNNRWDQDLVELEKNGRIPKVENSGDPSDPGILARQSLYNIGIKYGSSDLNKIADLRDDLKSVPPTGSLAPVGSSSATTQAPKNVKYDDIHNKSYDDLTRDEFQT